MSVIGADELDGVRELNALEAVQRLRPQWLKTRGPETFFSTGTPVRLYVDGLDQGTAASLRGISANTVQSMRFVSGREATARYGTDHSAGAILVTLRR